MILLRWSGNVFARNLLEITFKATKSKCVRRVSEVTDVLLAGPGKAYRAIVSSERLLAMPPASRMSTY